MAEYGATVSHSTGAVAGGGGGGGGAASSGIFDSIVGSASDLLNTVSHLPAVVLIAVAVIVIGGGLLLALRPS